MTRGSNGERLARIEAILEENLVRRLDEMGRDLKAIRKDLDDDKADLASLKNRGIGLLVGVGLAGGAVGAAAVNIWKSLLG